MTVLNVNFNTNICFEEETKEAKNRYLNIISGFKITTKRKSFNKKRNGSEKHKLNDCYDYKANFYFS